MIVDRALTDQIARLLAWRMADSVPVFGSENDGLMTLVAWGNHHQLTVADVHVTLQMMGIVPTKIFGRVTE